MNFKRKTFLFSHPEAKAPKEIKAYSQSMAWKKMKNFVRTKMFGDWALVYDQKKLDEVMKNITLVN